MPNRRDAVLNGTLEAARLHRDLHIQDRIDVFGGRVDVFAAIIDRGARLVFRKLDGLLGAYLPSAEPGILITTERNLAIQRYTGGHELGHYYMNHSASLDEEEILHRSSMTSAEYAANETAADAFSAEFLMPEWLVDYHAKRQGWAMDSLADVVNVYQLSLRVGLSYEATCWILRGHKLVTRSGTDKLLSTQPKRIKKMLLSGHSIPDWYANVWFLTEKDEGAAIFGEPKDVFVVRLKEHTGSGYLWNIDQVASAGFVVVADERQPRTRNANIGGLMERTIMGHPGERKLGNFDFTETRPWNTSDVFGQFSFAYDLRGKEYGLPRAARERLMAA